MALTMGCGATIANDTVVQLHFLLKDSSGKQLDGAGPEAPLLYLHGHGNLVPGLEEALAGKAVGDRVEVEVPPEKGYGVKQRIKAMKALRSDFPDGARLERGVSFMMAGPDGQSQMVWVTKVMGREIHLTPQHPLAGVTLHFDCTVQSVRAATSEETAQGWPNDDSTQGCGCC